MTPTSFWTNEFQRVSFNELMFFATTSHSALRYGNRCIELARGRRAVQVENLAEVVATLKTLREAASEG